MSAAGSVRFEGRTMQLLWYIGSGAAGQSFLWSDDGFLFQAPVTWYSQKHLWDVSPGYQHDRSTRWNRPVEPDCLYCHASLDQTDLRYSKSIRRSPLRSGRSRL